MPPRMTGMHKYGFKLRIAEHIKLDKLKANTEQPVP